MKFTQLLRLRYFDETFVHACLIETGVDTHVVVNVKQRQLIPHNIPEDDGVQCRNLAAYIMYPTSKLPSRFTVCSYMHIKWITYMWT